MWPFDIFAKRRAREAKQQREEHDRRMQQIKDSIEAANRRQRASAATISQAQGFRAAAAQSRPTLRAVPSSSSAPQVSAYDDPLSPINPLSPLNPINHTSTWSVPDEPRHTSSHCDTSSSHSSHSSSDHSSHSSHDHSCSSSYDSSSYDSGSSSISSDY